MTTRSNFHQSLDELHKELVKMGLGVERLIHQAVESLSRRDEAMAGEVIDADDNIDGLMMGIEQHCLNLIALQQPLAGDLRQIGTALKIAIDLERVADHAVDIAKITIRMTGQPLPKPLVDIPAMAEIAEDMLRSSIAAYMNRDIQGAAALAQKDDKVDKLYSTIHEEMIAMMGTNATVNRQLVHLLLAAHNLERVADHATNIGEGVIFLVTGKHKDLNI